MTNSMTVVMLCLLGLTCARAYTWQEVDLGNMYGGEYQKSTSWKAGKLDTPEECLSLCGNLTNCTWFDIAVGDQAGKKCASQYLNECWLSSDNFWEPKEQSNCKKHAGRKVGPTPPPPPPPAPAPQGSKNVLFIIFDDCTFFLFDFCHGRIALKPIPRISSIAVRIIHEAWGQRQPAGPW
jgi:hypothetical protein